MQQYFTDIVLRKGDILPLEKDILHHLETVLRKDEAYIFRIADKEGKIFFAHLLDKKNALIEEETGEDNELSFEVTAILSLVKPEKFEWALQKLTELGVKRIVPYVARRSVIRKAGKNTVERYQKICREASEQSHRNFVPEVTEYASFKDLPKYLSEVNLLPYEKEEVSPASLDDHHSVSFLIGPEGGFEEEEVEAFRELGFTSVTLGKRILRAETAAVFMMSLLSKEDL